MRNVYLTLFLLFSTLFGGLKLCADDRLSVSEQRWLNMLLDEIPSISEPHKATAITMAVVVLSETEHDEEARALANQQPDEETKNSLLTSITAALAYKSKLERAFITVEMISDVGLKERATHFIAMELARQGNFEHAEALINNMTESYHVDRVLVEMCEYLAREGRSDEALSRSRNITDTYRQKETIKGIERIRSGTAKPLEQITGSLGANINALTAFSSERAYDTVLSAIVHAQKGEIQQAQQSLHKAIADLNITEIPPKKFPTAILAMVALVELGDKEAASKMVKELYERVGQDWSGLSSAFGSPILISLLVRLERFDAIEQILAKARENYQADPQDSEYLWTLQSIAESLVEHGYFDEFESRLKSVKTPDEKLYLLMGALCGANYAKEQER